MYNPDIIREVEQRVYEGVKRTYTQAFNVENDRVRVDRPRGLVQRSHMDFEGTGTVMKADTIARAVDPRFDSSGFQDLYADHLTENTRLELVHPFTQATSSIVFRPESADQNENYKSRPDTLHRVLRYTADPDQYRNTSKCVELSTRYVRYNRAVLRDVDAHQDTWDTFNWEFRDNPGSAMIFLQHEEDLLNSRRWLRCADVRDGEHHNPMGQLLLFRDGDEWTLEPAIIVVPAVDVCRCTKEGLLSNNLRITHMRYEINARTVQTSKDGFAYFGSEPIHVSYRGYRMVHAITGVITVVPHDDVNHGVGLANKPAILAISDAQVRMIALPPVRFTITEDDAIHGNFTVGGGPGPLNWREQFAQAVKDPREWAEYSTYGDSNMTFADEARTERLYNDFVKNINPGAGLANLYAWPVGDHVYPNTVLQLDRAQDEIRIAMQGVNLHFVDTNKLVVDIQDANDLIGHAVNANHVLPGYGLIRIVQHGTTAICKVFSILSNTLQIQVDTAAVGANEGAARTYFNGLFTFPGAPAPQTLNADTPIELSPYFELGIFGAGAGDFGILEDDQAPNGLDYDAVPRNLDAIVCPASTYIRNLGLDDLGNVDPNVLVVIFTQSEYDSQSPFIHAYNFTTRTQAINGVDHYLIQLHSHGHGADIPEISFGDRIGVIRRPPYTVNAYRQIAQGNVPNQATITLNDNNRYAYRRAGYNVRFSDPIICGPLTPFPFCEGSRPLNSGCVILPKRISNYSLDMEYAPLTIKDTEGKQWLFTPTLNSVRCSYLSEHLDVHESLRLYAPKVVRQYLNAPAQDAKYRFTLRNGPPNYIVILQYGTNTRFKFTLLYRDEECPALRNAEYFSYYEMNQRAISRRNRKSITEWITDGCPLIIKWEELGIWGPIQEWPDRFEIDFMITENSPGDLEVLYVYENFALYSDHFGVKFAHI